ncbi:response regulator [Cohnella caldifontis]|uniref:response regulator n=1 Tax=Cohnella caldifontis TaxID=3027471 RepID=UPI0023EAF55D|nr:response regulator [Cohnella sp. YIM B05605]
MFSMMIVDDEPLVRKGIATSIEWDEHGIGIAAEAGNGKDALEKLARQKVDLVLADIRMPVMNGIELSEQIKTLYPDISIVLLSGYEDFAYAKAALQIGVDNYLLKPATAESLVSVITGIRDKKREEQLRRSKEMNRIRILNENLPYIKYAFMNSLLKKELSPEEIEQRLKTLQIPLDGSEYQVVLINIDDYAMFSEKLSQKENEAFKFAVFNIAEETLLAYFTGFVCYGELNRLIALVATRKVHSLYAVCEEIQISIKRYLKLSVTMGIGLPCASLSDIRRSYSEADQALKEKVYQGKGKIFLYSKERRAEDMSEERASPPTTEERALAQYLKLMNVPAFHRTIDEFFGRLASGNPPFEEVKSACVRLIVLLIQTLEEMGFRPDPIFGSPFIPHVAIERFEVLADLEAWVRRSAEGICRMIEENQRDTYKRTVKEAIQYIESHYGEPISLGQVADYVKVTPAYFSKIFKEETGIPFVKWLTRLRIEKAKALLRETRLKTYEIAEKVGYYDYKYFSNTFRQYTGFSPRDYRNR